MTGIIIEILISWLLLKYIQQEKLNVLGLAPTQVRIRQLLIGLLLPVAYTFLFEFSVAAIVHNPYRINTGYRLIDFGNASWYLVKSVAFEDLLFRGALFYILLKRTSAAKAILISAMVFGVYHWFSWNAFGNPVTMLMILLMTASAGYIFAMAFERTGSMYLGAGLHFGIDLAKSVLFSQDKSLGQQLLLKTYSKDPVSPEGWIGLIVIVIHFIGFQALVFWWLKQKRIYANGQQQIYHILFKKQ